MNTFTKITLTSRSVSDINPVRTRLILSDNDPDVIRLVDYAIAKGFGVHVAKVSSEEAEKLIRSEQEVARVVWLLHDALQ